MQTLQICPPYQTDVASLPWEIQKGIFNSICHTYFWLFTLSQKKTNCNLLAHPTWNVITLTCELQNFFVWFVAFFQTLEALWVVIGYDRWLWKEPVVMCGNWNVRQATLQQVFSVVWPRSALRRASFSTLVSRIVHHAVLKFNPFRNKPAAQASTCPYQYTRSSCSVTQTQY